MVRRALSRCISPAEINSLKPEGSLVRGLVFHDPELSGLKGLPPGSRLKAQKVEVSFSLFRRPAGIIAGVYNGRLLLPWGDSLFFYGDYRGGQLDIKVFTDRLSINETLAVLFKSPAAGRISGSFTGIDFRISGTPRELLVEGGLRIDNASYRNFRAADCPVKASVKLSACGDGLRAAGKAAVSGGRVGGDNTAVITLGEGAAEFNGRLGNTALFLNGSAVVEGTRIDVALGGTAAKPELRLFSQSPLSQDRLLLMLATNKGWQSAESAVSSGRLPADMAADFLDYFIFGGSAGRFVRELGIRDVSVKIDARSTEVGATKDITGNASIRYSLEQVQEAASAPVSYHKLSAEYKITDAFSLGAERVTAQRGEADGEDESRKIDDKIFLKFKADF